MDHVQADYEKVREFIEYNYDISKIEPKDFGGIKVPNDQTDVLCEWSTEHGLRISEIGEDMSTVVVEDQDKFEDAYELWQYESKKQSEVLEFLEETEGVKDRDNVRADSPKYVLRRIRHGSKVDFPGDNMEAMLTMYNKDYIKVKELEDGCKEAYVNEEKFREKDRLPLLSIEH